MKNQSNAWNFDNLESMKTTAPTQKTKKTKKTLSLGLNSTVEEVAPVTLEKTSEIEIKVKKEDFKPKSASSPEIEFNALLKKPSNPVIEEEVVEITEPEENSLMKNWSASQDNKDSLEEIKRKNAESRPFEMVAYKEPQNQQNLLNSQMGSFLFSLEKIVPEPLKGKSWEKSSEEQKKTAIKLTFTVLLSLSMIVGIFVGKGLSNPTVKPSTVVATTEAMPTSKINIKEIEKEAPVSENKKETNKKVK